ncbi:MAG TPA: hypothetical protein VNA44_09710, partial [Burkholderiaceae bacterium]|nr:hypothetical protein [Burkholderiaceae bacterium]
FDSSWEKRKDEILGRLVNELGINRVRIEIKSGVENPIDYWARFRNQEIGYAEYRRHYYEKINDNDDPNAASKSGFQFSMLDYQVENIVVPLAKLLESRGEKLYVNLTYVDFVPPAHRGNLSHALKPEEYAELIHATFDHLKRRHGLTPDALGVTLEPENTEHWRGRQIGAALVAAARRLKQAGFTPEFIAPSTTAASAAPVYFDEIVKVPGAAELMSEFSYHRYRDSSVRDVLPEIARRAKKYGLRTGMLEHVAGNVAELHADLTVANASAWQQYGIAAELRMSDRDKGAHYYNLEFTRAGPVLKMAERTRGLAQYFRFIRAGATRIGAASTSADHLPVAFKNSNGMHVVVVQADRAGAINVAGLPAGDYETQYTTATETAVNVPVINIAAGGVLTARLPAKGVVTVYQRNAR